jgi:hypothetical protein
MRRVRSHAAPFEPWMRAGASRLRQWCSARSKFKRTGVQHGVRKRCRLFAIFRPPTVSVATRTLTSGARSFLSRYVGKTGEQTLAGAYDTSTPLTRDQKHQKVEVTVEH